MTTIQKDEYIFSVDIEKTKNIIKRILFVTVCIVAITMHK